MFLYVTHYEVLDFKAAAAFQKLHLGDACGTDCGAAASFKILISRFTLVLVEIFVLCDVGYFFVAKSHSVEPALTIFRGLLMIHVLLIWLLLSVKFSVSSSTSLRNSLMSPSHLLLGLPIALLVLYF